MSLLDIRKIVIQLEETHIETGKSVFPAPQSVTVAAVISNHYAGQNVEDLEAFYDLGNESWQPRFGASYADYTGKTVSGALITWMPRKFQLRTHPKRHQTLC